MPTLENIQTNTFQVGDRVCMSPYGIQVLPKYVGRIGTVVGHGKNTSQSLAADCVKIIFDGFKSVKTVNIKFVQKLEKQYETSI